MDRRNLLSTGMVLALGGLLPAAEAAEEAPNTTRGLLLNGISGTTLNRAGQAGTFTGTILIKRVGLDNETRTLKVYGLVNGTAGSAGNIVNQKFVAIATLVPQSGGGRAAVPATCNILNLTLGPIHLNLLGLVIDVPNPIVLNITGVTGALLGDLLCALSNLLNPGLGPLGQILKLLGQITSVLGQGLATVNPPAAR